MSTEPEEQISADEEFDETIVVAQPVDDATVVVARPANDATIVVAQPVDDETIVVASTRRARRDAETRSAGSAQKLAPAQDPASVHTPVAAQNQAAAQDLDVPDPAVSARPERSAPADPEDDATRVVGRSAGRDPAPPVVEQEPEYSSAEFAKLMFKPPLDPRRRVKEAPFPQPEHTLPKRGVSQGMPVIFGARPEVLDGLSSANLDLGRRLGAAPASTVMTPARREGLPSMALLNRKFRVLALAGGAGVCIVVGLGLWGIAALAFG